jgi:hypothetical protein
MKNLSGVIHLRFTRDRHDGRDRTSSRSQSMMKGGTTMNPTPEAVEPASTEPDTGPDVQQQGDFQGDY